MSSPSAEKTTVGPSYVSSLTSVVKTIEVDPRVPGIRDEIPFPQAKQCSPELDFPSCQFRSTFSQKLQRSQ